MTTVVIPLYRGVTHLDFTGPHQCFSRTPGAHVIAASLDQAPIAAEGLTFANLAALEQIDRCDVLCVPGGAGCVSAMEDERFMAIIRRLAVDATYVTSICTGSLILAAAGVLTGRRAACHWAWADMLRSFGATPVNKRVVRDGNAITGGGITAGIDLALVAIAEIWGSEEAQSVQLLLEYAPAPPFDAGLPERAPIRVHEAVVKRITRTVEDARRRINLMAAQSAGRPADLHNGTP